MSPEGGTMISADEAVRLIMGHVPLTGRTTLSPGRAAGHALAADVIAGENVPPFDNAAMDGYAVRSADTAPGGVVLNINGETAAGDPPAGTVGPGEAHAIMTGAPLPAGADAVVRIEETTGGGDGTVMVRGLIAPGTHIRPSGSDIRRGEKVLSRGQVLRPFELAVLASLGISFIEVYRRPRVSLFSTGNELAPATTLLRTAQIRESSSHALRALLAEAGCDVSVTGIAPDRDDVLKEMLDSGMRADMLITTGGVSAGKYDSLPRLLEEAGATIIFHRVNIRPGMPLLFAMAGTVPVFALPGNPVSAVVTFLEFVRPAIRKMSGESDPASKRIVRAKLGTDLRKTDSKKHFMRGRYLVRDGEGVVVPAGPQASNIMSVFAAANCIMIVPEEARELKQSDHIDVELL